jgi:hypothetical protein
MNRLVLGFLGQECDAPNTVIAVWSKTHLSTPEHEVRSPPPVSPFVILTMTRQVGHCSTLVELCKYACPISVCRVPNNDNEEKKQETNQTSTNRFRGDRENMEIHPYSLSLTHTHTQTNTKRDHACVSSLP